MMQVTNEDDVIAALDLAESAFGEPVNTAVNCAGIAHAIRTLSKKGVHQLFQFQQTLTVNTVGSFNVARLAAERYVLLFAVEPHEILAHAYSSQTRLCA